MSAYSKNQFAPSFFEGVNLPPPQQVGYEDRPYDYIYNPLNGQLTALQNIVGDTVAIQTDADFLLYAVYISLYTAPFQVQFVDSYGYQLSNGFMNSGAFSQSSSNPTVFSPAHPFPAGGKILINIQDLSGATNNLQLVFKGVKRFRVSLNGR